MRITSIRVAPVAGILAIVYAAFGLIVFLVFAIGSDQSLTLPFGVVLPLFHLNLNFHLARSTDLFYNIFLCLAAILSYSVTGWLTGVAIALSFNLIARYTGGIDARYVSVVENEDTRKSLPLTAKHLGNSEARS